MVIRTARIYDRDAGGGEGRGGVAAMSIPRERFIREVLSREYGSTRRCDRLVGITSKSREAVSSGVVELLSQNK